MERRYSERKEQLLQLLEVAVVVVTRKLKLLVVSVMSNFKLLLVSGTVTYSNL
mgnify:CR=1 FL=1